MGYNAKNYTEQGGAVTHIGGKLVFDDGATLEGGIVENVPASEATTVAKAVEDLNALISALKASGVMAPDAD
jgi:hypothetical protein